MDETTGYEETSDEALLAARDRLLVGLGIVADHLEKGTFHKRKKEGAATPAESGWLNIMFLAKIEDELEARILGFKRALDLDLLKTL